MPQIKAMILVYAVLFAVVFVVNFVLSFIMTRLVTRNDSDGVANPKFVANLKKKLTHK